jgi:UDP-glucose:(glucosyl)LPS alpha-1,2-glucosyltransferase
MCSMLKYKLSDMKKGDVDIPQHKLGNMAENSMGGTELVTMELFKRLPDEYKDYFQFVISRKYELEEKPRIYWVHDLPLDPAHSFLVENNGLDLFEKMVFVSHWQQDEFNRFLKIPYSKGEVIKNAIDPIEYHVKEKTEKLQLIYASTPQRGLDVLLGALNLIRRYDFHLHVYSSFALYGWEELDEQYNPLFERIKSDPRMTYHGFVPYDELRKVWKRMHILTYPSTWPETSCRVAMEAMTAHCAIVTSNLAALPETCGEFAYMYTYTENKAEHAKRFADMLKDVMDHYWSEKIQKNIDMARDYAYTHYNWSKRIEQWMNFLYNLKYQIEYRTSE